MVDVLIIYRGGGEVKRVKFFPTNDLMCGYNLSNIEKILNKFQSHKERRDVLEINDMIELYNLKKYFDNKIYLKDWSNDYIKDKYEIICCLFEIVARFFRSIDQRDFIDQYKKVQKIYIDDFWELVEKFEAYKNIDDVQFEEILKSSGVLLADILKKKKVVAHFGKAIRDYMLLDSSTAELLLEKFEMEHIFPKDPLYFPKGLSSTDKEAIINNYIESEDPNINYLGLIGNIQSSKDKIEISPKTLLKAKKKTKEKEKQLFTEISGMNLEISVSFSESQDEPVIFKKESQALKAKYSTKWIENNSDKATLLNNFIYLFDFLDLQMRFTLVNKFNLMNVFERFLFISSQNDYKTGIEFKQKDFLSLLQIKGYYNRLFSLGIRLEEVMEWFFKGYLVKEFNAPKFKIAMPSSKATILEKCIVIIPALEQVLKQFSLFVQEGNIDFELLEIRSEPIVYKNIPSLVDKKYVYGTGHEFKEATFLLFSDQSGLGYNEKNQKSYKNFFQLLCTEKIELGEYPNFWEEKIRWLIDHEYLSIDREGYIFFRDKTQTLILKDLFFNEVINYWNYPNSGRLLIDELERKNIIEFENTLFSRPEQDYINFYLNKSQFINGFDLRNKYVHGQLGSVDNEEKHYDNYIKLLRIFILAVLKINDDFCISDRKKDLMGDM